MRALVALPVLAVALLGASLPGCSKEGLSVPDAGVHLDAVPDGSKELDYVQYNDANDVWRVFVVGRPKADEPLRLSSVRLARLPAGSPKKAHVINEGGSAVLWVPEDFHIGYLHVLTTEQLDPETHRPVRVASGNQKRLWYPFRNPRNIDPAIFDQPAFYFAPPLNASGPLLGFGGYGPTREAAVMSYRAANGELPPGPKNVAEGLLLVPPPKIPEPAIDSAAVGGPPPQAAKTPGNRSITAVPGSKAALQRARKMVAEERAAVKPRKRGEAPPPKPVKPAKPTK